MKKYPVKVRCVGGDSSERVKKMAGVGEISSPFKILYDEAFRSFYAYIDTTAEENRVGRVENFGGKTFQEIRKDPALTETLSSIADGVYEMRITGIDEKGFLTGTIAVSEMSEKNEKTGESKALADAWDAAAKRCVQVTGEYRAWVTDLWDKNEIPENMRLYIVSGYVTPEDDEGNVIPLYKPACKFVSGGTGNEKGVYRENTLLTVYREILNGNPVILQGPKSVGKNLIMECAAYSLLAPYYEGSACQDETKYDYLGDKTIDPSVSDHLNEEDAESYVRYRNDPNTCDDIDGAFRHEYWSSMNRSMRFIVEDTEFKKWARQAKGKRVFMLNEINFGNPNVLAAIFNRAAEDREERFLDIPGGERIYFSDDCILTASMNKDYVGTVELNEAMRSRFGVIEMQPAATIKGILKDKTEEKYGKGILPDEYYRACDNLYDHMLKRSAAGSASKALYGDKAISIRGFGRALKDVVFDKKLSANGSIPKNSLSRALNVHLRCLGDTPQEQAAITQDIGSFIDSL